MANSPAARDNRTIIAAASLIAGPLLMAVGDLLHPQESMMPAEQAAIIVELAGRWYTSHLLLFIGLMLFIPGLLALAALAEARKPAAGHAARILILVGTAAVASIFVAEMLLGRYVLDGGTEAGATELLETMFSGPMMGAVGPAMLAFFAGTAIFAIPLARAGGTVGRAAVLILVGVLFILAEILTAQVLLSQIGNILVFFGSATAARLILRDATRPAATSRA